MIPSGLNELFGTLFVGLICLLTLALPLHVFAPGWRNQFYRILEWKNEGPRVLVFVLMVYGVGVLVNQVGNKATDSQRGSTWAMLALGLPTEGELRLSALVKEEQCQRKLTGLGKEVCGNTRALENFRVAALDHHESMRSFVTSLALENQLTSDPAPNHEGKLQPDSPIQIANALYYRAKNRVMTAPTLAPELAQIQRTIDWCRSTAIASEVGVLLAGIVLIYVVSKRQSSRHAVHAQTRRLQNLDGAVEVDPLPAAESTPPIRWTSASGIVVCWMALLSMSRFGYEESSREFNQRAFGYHISEVRGQATASDSGDRAGNDAIGWMLKSEEYRGLALSVFRAAKESLFRYQDTRNAKRAFESKPLCVVMDVDDTLMQSVRFNALARERNLGYSQELFVGFEHLHTDILQPVPGALEFVDDCLAKGVVVYFVSNRLACEAPLVQSWLVDRLKQGAGLSSVHFRFRPNGSGDEKDQRRAEISTTNEIALLVGDSLADFDDRFTSVSRHAMGAVLTPADLGNLGSRWFLLPNPVYGAWKQ